MRLDIRLPIGIFFSTMGVLLGVFGLLGSKAIYARSLGVNVNLEWGGVLLVFGIVMIALALRGRARPGIRDGINGSSRIDGEDA